MIWKKKRPSKFLFFYFLVQAFAFSAVGLEGAQTLSANIWTMPEEGESESEHFDREKDIEPFLKKVREAKANSRIWVIGPIGSDKTTLVRESIAFFSASDDIEHVIWLDANDREASERRAVSDLGILNPEVLAGFDAQRVKKYLYDYTTGISRQATHSRKKSLLIIDNINSPSANLSASERWKQYLISPLVIPVLITSLPHPTGRSYEDAFVTVEPFNK